MIQPIVVRLHGHRFQIVAGERAGGRRRRRGCTRCRRSFASSATRDVIEIALIENIQREDLNAIEEAQAYQRLVQDFGHTQEELGKIVHKSRSHVANLLRLLDLPAEVQVMVGTGELSMGHARALITAPPIPSARRRGGAPRPVGARDRAARPRGKPTRQRPLPIELQGRQRRHRRAGAAAGRHARPQGDDQARPKGGTVTLSYSTLDQLDMICQRLSGRKVLRTIVGRIRYAEKAVPTDRCSNHDGRRSCVRSGPIEFRTSSPRMRGRPASPPMRSARRTALDPSPRRRPAS